MGQFNIFHGNNNKSSACNGSNDGGFNDTTGKGSPLLYTPPNIPDHALGPDNNTTMAADAPPNTINTHPNSTTVADIWTLPDTPQVKRTCGIIIGKIRTDIDTINVTNSAPDVLTMILTLSRATLLELVAKLGREMTSTNQQIAATQQQIAATRQEMRRILNVVSGLATKDDVTVNP
jgi:hypothetical protein